MSHNHSEPTPKKAWHKFKILYSYVTGQERGVDQLLADAKAIEGLIVSNFNVYSVLETNRESLCIQYTEEFDQIIAGYTDGIVRFYKANNMELLQALSDEDLVENPAPVTSIRHRPISKNHPITNTVICTYANGCVKCWNYNYSQCLYTIREKRQTFGVAYHPRLPKFVTCGDDCKIYLYDEENRIQERIFSGSNTPGVLDGHTSRVFAASFNPRSNHELITGGWDDVIQFWDARMPFAVRYISGVHICGDSIDIHPKGTEILTCAWQKEKAIQVWDYGSGKLIQTVEPDEFSSKLYAGGYLNKDYLVCGGTEPNILRLLETKHYYAIGTINRLPGAVYSITQGPYKKGRLQQSSDTMITTRRKSKVGYSAQKPIDIGLNIPRIAISSGKKIFQLEI